MGKKGRSRLTTIYTGIGSGGTEVAILAQQSGWQKFLRKLTRKSEGEPEFWEGTGNRNSLSRPLMGNE